MFFLSVSFFSFPDMFSYLMPRSHACMSSHIHEFKHLIILEPPTQDEPHSRSHVGGVQTTTTQPSPEMELGGTLTARSESVANFAVSLLFRSFVFSFFSSFNFLCFFSKLWSHAMWLSDLQLPAERMVFFPSHLPLFIHTFTYCVVRHYCKSRYSPMSRI
jgi:hypothetical protein